MKIFMTFSALILCFVIHGVLTGRLIPSTRIVLDKCFQNLYSNNCSEDFEKVISTVSNKWCCIKFIYNENEKNDDEALQNNVMTSSGNGNENMTTNITISLEAYDDSITTDDDVSTDTKLDNDEKYQNSMLDETDSINMNEAIDDSSLSIDSQLNGAADDKNDDAEAVQQAGKNFESNLNANEKENELSDTRMGNQDEFETLIDIDNEDLRDENIAENEGIVPKKFNEDENDDLIMAVAVDSKFHDEDIEEFEEVQKFDQDLKIDFDPDTESKIPQYMIDRSKEFNDNPDSVEITNEDSRVSTVDESFSSFETDSTLSTDYTDLQESTELNEPDENDLNVRQSINDSDDNINKDLPTLSEESTDTNPNSIELESDLNINNQFEEINAIDDAATAEQSNSFNSTDSNLEIESSEDAKSVDENLLSDENLIEVSNVENSFELKNEIGGNEEINENQLDENSNLEIPNSNLVDVSSEEFQEISSQDSDSSVDIDVESENTEEIQVFDTTPIIPKLTTKSSFLTGSRKRSKLSVLNKFKSNQPSLINKSPRKSFKKNFTNRLTQRGQRLNSKKNQSKFNLEVNPSQSKSKDSFGIDRQSPSEGHTTSDLNSDQLLEVNENSPETNASSNDDDLNEFQKQHDNADSSRHEDIMNVNSEDNDENENSLNNPKSSSESLNDENVFLDTNTTEEENIDVEQSRQQQISKLSKQSPTSDSNDSLQSDNLVENESNQVEDSVTEKVKNDNNELQFENSIDGTRQRGDEKLQHDNNRVDDNNRENENDELENNQIGDEIDGNGGDEMAVTKEKGEFIRDKGGVKRRPALNNKLGKRVNRKDSGSSNIVETVDNQADNAAT